MHLLKIGHSISVIFDQNDWDAEHFRGKGSPDRLIIAKLSHPSPEMFDGLMDAAMDHVDAAHQRGAKVLMDYSDDLLGHGDHRRLRTLQLLQRVDRVICASSELARRVQFCLGPGADVCVVPDPVEGDRVEPGRPRCNGDDVFRILWFGHVSNLDSLLNSLHVLAATRISAPIELEILTSLRPDRLFELQFMLLGLSLPYFLRFSEWQNPLSLADALRRSDVVFLPIDPGSSKVGASNNRLTQAFWGGCFVVASPIESYLGFADLAWLREDLASGLDWAAEHPQEANKIVCSAQQRIASQFSPEMIGLLWDAALAP
jgi:glycosyltransferase involved in cell wall biosynthesis